MSDAALEYCFRSWASSNTNSYYQQSILDFKLRPPRVVLNLVIKHVTTAMLQIRAIGGYYRFVVPLLSAMVSIVSVCIIIKIQLNI